LHIFYWENQLSDITKFSSKTVKGWLESETSSIFNPVHTKAQKLLDEMRRALESLVETSKTLLENSGKEIEKRNMKTYRRARALNKLARLFLDRTRQTKVPDKVSYDSFHEFVQGTQKVFSVTEVDIRNWFPRISPYFILDRRKFQGVFEKAKELLRELNDFLTKEYVKTKTLEETFQLIDKLKDLEEQLTSLNEQKKKIEDEKTVVANEIAETQQKMAYLKNKGELSQLSQINKEIEALRMQLKHNLRHLRKPFLKFQSLTTRGAGSGLTPDELKKLTQYMGNPFLAFATEEADYPLLRQVLQKLVRSMSEGKLKLKSDRERKAKQDIDNILDKNSLASLYQKCNAVIMQRRQLSTSTKVTQAKNDLSDLQESIEELERKKGIVESKENKVNQAYDETQEKIRNCKDTIEKNIFSFMNRRVQIE
jgi:peptidoglycan hydrolase CwlO-like protein